MAPPWAAAGVGRRQTSWRRCRACRLQAPGFGRLLALDDYPGDLRAWILALKHGRRELAAPLARLLNERLAAAGWWTPTGPKPLLVPVPSFALRRLERSLDAPWLLATALARETQWPVRRLLRRKRHTAPQGEPGSLSRSANVRGAFGLGIAGHWMRIGPTRAGPRPAVVLVDDVVSSGATLSECARVLRGLGVRHLGGVCLARAERARS